MMIKTITINGSEEITLSSEPYFYKSDRFVWVRNRSDGEMTLSTNGTDLLDIPAGQAGRAETPPDNTIYLGGNGTADIYTSDIAACPWRIAGSSGGGGGSAVLGTKNISENGVYNASSDGFDGFSRVTVDVEASPVLDTKDITENGTYTAADEGLDGFSEVTVDVPEYFLPDAYRQIDYVQCGTGSNQQSGFVLRNLEVTSKHICEMVTITPPYVNAEAGFWGVDGQNVEIYYDSSFELADYGVAELISNSTELTPDGFTKNTTRMKHTGGSRFDINIGYYRAGRYPYVGRIYSCKFMLPIVDANGNSTGREKVLIDLVPCVRISDGVVGMFDLVSQVFYQSRTDLDPFTE